MVNRDEHDFRPHVSEKNFLLVQKLTNNPVNHNFDRSLSELLKKFKKTCKKGDKN